LLPSSFFAITQTAYYQALPKNYRIINFCLYYY
jgi:hypothetical protein